MASWNDRLYEARVSKTLSRRTVAERAGVGESTYARYESGQRVPRRERLVAIGKALELSPDSLDEVLADAGYEPEPDKGVRALASRGAGVDAVRDALESYPWSCLLSNEYFEIRGWNGVALRLAEMDFSELDGPDKRHFLRLAAMPHFQKLLVNWDELIGRMIGFWKESFADEGEASVASAYFARLVEDLNRDAPDILLKVGMLWATVPAFEASFRNAHPVEWRVSDGTLMRFDAVFRSWNDYEGLMSFDWHPADADTWRWLNRQPREWPDWAVQPQEVLPEDARPWHELLAAGRARTGKTWKQVSGATGISVHTLYSFAAGRRRPQREDVMAMAKTLEMDGATTNVILRSLGMSDEPSGFARWLCGLPPIMPWGHSMLPMRAAGDQEVRDELERLRWPCLVLDENCCFVGANGAARAALELGEPALKHVFEPGAHLIELITDRAVRERIVNWEEAAIVLMPSTVKPFLNPAISASDTSKFEQAVTTLRRKDPEVLHRLIRMWDQQPEALNRLRITFPLNWRAVDGTELQFNGVVAGWTAMSGLWAIDLHAADAETFDWMSAHPALG